MAESKIKIYVSPNETVTGKERIAAMQPYLLRHVDEFEVHRDEERGSDLVFEMVTGSVLIDHEEVPMWKRLAVELKRPLDYATSCQNGHMASQRRDSQYPLVVWVLGSMGDVMRALPGVGENGPKTIDQMRQDRFAVLRWTAKLRASGVDVRFGLSPKDFERNYADEEMALKANMAQVLREAKAYLESDYHLPMPKSENVQEAMLQCLPGIGPKTSAAVLENNIRPRLMIGSIFADESTLMSVDGIGKVTAQKIMEAMR